MNSTPKQNAKQLEILRHYLPALRDRLGDTAWLEQFLRDAQREQLQGAALHFELHADGHCSIGGKTLPKDGKGMALAWLVLACEQYRFDHLRVEHIGEKVKRPSVTAMAALRRAVSQAERVSVELAAAIRAVGTEHGKFALKSPVRGIRCTSAALAEIFKRAQSVA